MPTAEQGGRISFKDLFYSDGNNPKARIVMVEKLIEWFTTTGVFFPSDANDVVKAETAVSRIIDVGSISGYRLDLEESTGNVLIFRRPHDGKSFSLDREERLRQAREVLQRG